MQYQWYFTAILCVLALIGCGAEQTADKNANAKTKQILTYMAGLPKQGKILSGHFGGYSPNHFATHVKEMEEIRKQSGQTPAILSCDWGSGWAENDKPELLIDYACNSALIDHWKKGGLVAISAHLPNPTFAKGGGLKEPRDGNFPDLSNFNTDAGRRWKTFLDRFVAGLRELQQAGVTVLFRPLHEMNGDWFFWGDRNPETYKKVWRHMFDYITNQHSIHNLLWVHSPDQSRGKRADFYPGDDYVDIVALDAYSLTPSTVQGYEDMVKFNKVFAFAEMGPRLDDKAKVQPRVDLMDWIKAIESKFPRAAYFLTWDEIWSPIKHNNIDKFYNHARVINLGEVHLNGGGGGGSAAPSSGTVLYNFSHGIGQWKGLNLAGGPWRSGEASVSSTDSLKADVNLAAGKHYTVSTQEKSTFHLGGKKKLTAHARVASWGLANGGSVSAKVFIKAGSGWTWYDSGSVQLNSGASTAIVFDLTKVPAGHLNDVQELGVEFTSSANGGASAVYVSYITTQ